PIDADRARIGAEDEERDALKIEIFPAIVHGEADSFRAEALIAVAFVADTNPDIGRTVHTVDIGNFHVSDNGRVTASANSEYDLARVVADILAPLQVSRQIDRPIAEVQPGRLDVIEPVVERREVRRRQRAENDLLSGYHFLPQSVVSRPRSGNANDEIKCGALAPRLKPRRRRRWWTTSMSMQSPRSRMSWWMLTRLARRHRYDDGGGDGRPGPAA